FHRCAGARRYAIAKLTAARSDPGHHVRTRTGLVAPTAPACADPRDGGDCACADERTTAGRHEKCDEDEDARDHGGESAGLFSRRTHGLEYTNLKLRLHKRLRVIAPSRNRPGYVLSREMSSRNVIVVHPAERQGSSSRRRPRTRALRQACILAARMGVASAF